MALKSVRYPVFLNVTVSYPFGFKYGGINSPTTAYKHQKMSRVNAAPMSCLNVYRFMFGLDLHFSK